MLKRVLFIGVFSPTHSKNIPQLEELRRKGIDVTTFDYRANTNKRRGPFKWFAWRLFWALKLPFFPKPVRRLFYRDPARQGMAKELFSKIKGETYDLILISKAEDLHYKFLPKLRRHGPLFYYFMDYLKTARIVEADEYAKRCDYASTTWSDVLPFFGNTRKLHLIQGASLQDYKHLKRRKKKHDVIFVGMIDRPRRRLLSYLKRNGIKVEVYGPNTRNGPRYNQALTKLYQESRIILNINRPGAGFSARVFDAMATGSFLLATHNKDLEKFFVKGKHLEWFATKEECLNAIRHYLKHHKERETIAKAGRKKVLEDYTWKNQIERLLSFVEDHNKRKKT
ncbi:glycosyltransferase family 1 protein [Candidatus Woesearchaeota archaeon]|nr:glycosyltransferase family 1 protein [Candidatus Woesearchaeota archaeon]